MHSRRLLACHDCGVLQPVVRCPLDARDDADVARLEAYTEFIAAHAGHRLAPLRRHGTELCADHPVWDPAATLTFEATDGEATYLVRASRPSIEAARVYRFAPGRLVLDHAEVRVDAPDLQRALDACFYPHVLRATQLDRFLSAVHEVVGRIDPDALEIAWDAADDPAVSIAPMPDDSFQQLLARSAEIFDPSDWPRVIDFLSDNRHADGLLALHIRRHLSALSA